MITLNDVTTYNAFIASLFVELVDICYSSGKSINIGVVFRPPNTEVTIFNEVMEDLGISWIKNYILGDYNITVVYFDMHQPSGYISEIMFSHSLGLFINRPTRVTSNYVTIIDSIYSYEIINYLGYYAQIKVTISHSTLHMMNLGTLSKEILWQYS